VIPTHNRWDHLRDAALPAALGQRDVALELIVVDDGSADQTPRRLAEISDPRVRVLRSEPAEGVARARNRGLAAARAPWVAFLDDDDLWSPLKLRTQLDALAAADADYAYAAAVFVDGDCNPLRADPAPEPRTLPAALRRSDVVGGPSTVIMRSELARELGGFEPSLAVLADWDLWLRVAEVGRPAACHDVLVAYREHDGNMSAWAERRVFAELDVLVARNALRGEVDGDRFTRWVAANQRRAGRRLAAARAYLRGAAAFRSPQLLVRALGMPLGEGAMAIPGRLRALRGERSDPPPAPEWLDLYRG
jgi:glycosyltransferase involved in cell wall biosynthesis